MVAVRTVLMLGAQKWRVLIIEDERADREIYKRYFQESAAFEFDFTECDSALAGIVMSRQWSPDCILLDFNLPDMNGLEALNLLRGKRSACPARWSC